MTNAYRPLAAMTICLAAALLLPGCSAKGTAATSGGTSGPGTAEATASGGAYPYEKSPLLKDTSLLSSAADTVDDVRRMKVMLHTTAKKNGELTVADDDEITFVAPLSAHWMSQSMLTQSRSETIRIGSNVWTATDGGNWSRETTDQASYPWQPSELATLLRGAKNVHLFKEKVPQEWSASSSMVVFDRPSPVYPGQTQQVVVFIDDTTKLPVRLEFLDNQGKPRDFTETFVRLLGYDSPDLAVSKPD
jgi:hypothetical protein